MNRRLRVSLVAAAMMVVLIAPSPVSADDLEDGLAAVADRIRALAGQIDDVTAERSQLAAEIRAASGRMDRLLADVAVNQSAIEGLKAQIEAHEGRLEGVRVSLSDLYIGLYATQTEIAERRASAIESARDAYRTARVDTAAVTLSAERVSDISVALVYLERVANSNATAVATLLLLEDRAIDQQAAVTVEQLNLAAESSQMETLRSDLEHAHDDLARDRISLEKTTGELEALLAALDGELAKFSEELDALESEQTRIKRKIAEEQARRAAPPISAAGFVRPVPGAITSDYGPRVHPVLGHTRVHTGVDMAAGYGQLVKASRGGTVILAGNWGGYGRTVVIDHGGGIATLYAHLSSLAVVDGDTVAAGTVIGRVGTSGLSTGAHLHYEVRRRGDPVDPAPYLRG